MQLVIVESPTKAKKLQSYLGDEYQVEASVGHIRDLPKTGLGIDLEHNFTPEYVVSPDKQKVIKALRSSAKKATKIILATDPDREGEAIAWHITQVLDEVPAKNFERAVFHEVTKSAVLAAMAEPGEIKVNLVDAQQARRILDRLVGYEVSPVLWRKVRRGLSAGRVQSVALRLVVEREREIAAFVPEEYWELDVQLQANAGQLTARVVGLNSKPYKPTSQADVTPVVEFLPQAKYQVQTVDQKERKRSSLPPFTTSTLQQAAANRLGFSSKQTMRLAQQLYEEGLITYHRTDSVTLSSQALSMAREYISQTYGEKYLPEKVRVFANHSRNAQEAHEAIRVTQVKTTGLTESAQFTSAHQRLYDLIWRRFVASQMAESVSLQTTIEILATPKSTNAQVTQALLRAAGSVLLFDGWTKLFVAGDDVILPAVKVQEDLKYHSHTAAQKFIEPPARYNDASLVKELEKRGIGRPSTYASIISVILDRGYIERLQKRFFATPIGIVVCDFLQQHFPQFMEYEFTAEMEEDLDRVARGEKQWVNLLEQFYQPFHKRVSETTETAARVQVPVEETGETCPICGETEAGRVVIRSGKYGKFRSCSRYPECSFTEPIKDVLAGAMCPLCQQGEVLVRKSRWGKPFFGCARYPECNWASWQAPKPGDKITQEEWAIHQAAREARKAAKAAKFGKSASTKTKPKTKSKRKTKAKPKSKSSGSTKKTTKSTRPT